MSKLLGKEAYEAARKQTWEKLNTLRDVVFSSEKEIHACESDKKFGKAKATSKKKS